MDKEQLKKMLEEIEAEKAKGGQPEAGKQEVSAEVLKLAESLGDKITNAIKEAKGLSNADADAVKKMFGANGTGAIQYPDLKDLPSLGKEDKILVWFKSLMNKDKDAQAAMVFRALVEGTDSQGGYLVPEEFRAEVFRVMNDVAVMRKIARTLPMATDTLNLNTLAARPSAYWTAEYASKSTTSAEFGRVTLQPNDLVCLLPVTHQLIADANINIVSFITELFAEAIARAEDLAFFTGSGTGQPKGISQESLTEIDAGLNGSFDHLILLLHSVAQRVRNSPNFAFVAHNNVIRQLRTLKDGNSRYIWEPAVQVGQPDRVLGKPIYEQNDLNSRELYAGDWSYYIIGDRQQLTVETTSVGGDAWRRNATEIKAVERVDGKAVLTAAFAKITNW